MITHYDLFAGIGGFSLALDKIFHEQKNEHIFCEWEAFPTAVLKKHWPDATYYGDIADLVADTANTRAKTMHKRQKSSSGLTILTGGFPCQPFSHAGRRAGTSDDRYKWPDMFRVIQNVRPDWVIAENVRGLVTWNDGMVLETVCADLESEGYEVQPIIIPAVAVGAPHRRDRVWIVAHAIDSRQGREEQGSSRTPDCLPQEHRAQDCATREPKRADSDREAVRPATDPRSKKPRGLSSIQREEVRETRNGNWNQDWREVAFATCHDGVDDGLPRWMDGVTISASRHRKERLKACGNAIVPQVAMQLFNAIKNVHP